MPVQFCSQWQLQITNSRSARTLEYEAAKDTAGAVRMVLLVQKTCCFYYLHTSRMVNILQSTHIKFAVWNIKFIFCLTRNNRSVWVNRKDSHGHWQSRSSQQKTNTCPGTKDQESGCYYISKKTKNKQFTNPSLHVFHFIFIQTRHSLLWLWSNVT